MPGQLAVPTSALITDTLALDGVNLAPSADDLAQVSVGYGPGEDPWRYNCTLVPVLCSSRTLVCTTSPGGAGQLLRLVVSVGQQVHRGTDAYSYPELPVLERVSGCAVTDANATRGCPTEGGVNLTLFGQGFIEPIDVNVGGVACVTSWWSNDGRSLGCVLGAGSGDSLPVIVSQWTLNTAPSPFLVVSFAAPQLQSVSCDQGASWGVRASNCSREGGTGSLWVRGDEFGAAGAVLLVGGHPCSVEQQNRTFAACALPAGHLLEQPVLVVQARGRFSAEPLTVSYAQCPPGSYDPSNASSTQSCRPCLRGLVSTLPGQSSCTSCPSGSVPGVDQAACVACGPGSYADVGRSACAPCPAGTIAAGHSSPSCVPCTSGFPADNATQCRFCESGEGPNYSTRVCQECPLGLFSEGQQPCRACSSGSYAFTGDQCAPCGAGVVCEDGQLSSAADYWLYRRGMDGVEAAPCPVYHCRAGATLAEASCGEHRRTCPSTYSVRECRHPAWLLF